MDRTRTRRASLRRRSSEAPKPTFEELKPDFQWDQVDDTHHRLRIHFPGFVRQEINVEPDYSRKLIRITGGSTRRDTETTTRFITVDQWYQVPKDAVLEEMSMEFQDGLYLTIMIPILRKKKTKRDIGGEEKLLHRSNDDHGQKDAVEGGHFPKKSAESSTVDKKEQERREKDELVEELEMPKSDKQVKNLDENAIQKKVESDDKKDEPTPSSDDKLDKGPDTVEKPKIAGESKDDVVDTIQKRVESSDEREDGPTKKQDEPSLEEMRPKPGVDHELHELEEHKIEGPKSAGSRKRKAIWTGLLEEEKMKRSRRMILVAVVAFSLGFYTSHMLRSGESNQAYYQ